MNYKTIILILLLSGLAGQSRGQDTRADSLTLTIQHFDQPTGRLSYSIANHSSHTIRIGKPVTERAMKAGNLFVLQRTDSVYKRIYLVNTDGSFAIYKRMEQVVKYPINIPAHGHITRHTTVDLSHSTALTGASQICILFSCGLMAYPDRKPAASSYFTGRLVSNTVAVTIGTK